MICPLGLLRAFAYLAGMSFRFLTSTLAAMVLAAPIALAGSPHEAPGAMPKAPSPPLPPGEKPVVVELFTSQGCSDCPPADALLGELAKRKDVIALTLPVTYWDMMGWKDTFASEANTVRQKAYAKQMGRSGVYTPQIVVNGMADVVGGRRDQVINVIAAHTRDKPNIPIRVNVSPKVVQIAIGGDEDTDKDKDKDKDDNDDNDNDCTIWVMHTLNHADVKVGEGENKGRALGYTNIVRDLKAVGLWKGDAVTLKLPRNALAGAPHDGLVVLLQRDRYGQIVGATMVAKDK